MEELTGLFDLPQRSVKMVEGRGRSREVIVRRSEALLPLFDSRGGGRKGWWVGPPAATKHERNLLPPSLVVGCLDPPPR